MARKSNSLIFAEIPTALEPIYSTPRVNSSIQLYTGSMKLEQGGQSILSRGVVQVDWLPRPRMIFRFDLIEGDGGFLKLDHARLHWMQDSITVDCYITKLRFGNRIGPNLAAGFVEDFEVGSSHRLNHIVFHITNFRNCHGTGIRNKSGSSNWAGRTVVETDGWRITIDKINYKKQIFNDLNSTGGFAITHVGKLERLDGSLFKYKDCEYVVESLYRYLSFCRGIWVAPILSVGYDHNSSKVFSSWKNWKIERWRQIDSWFSDFTAQGLSDGFPGFLTRWKSDMWKEPLLLSLHWYGEASMSAGGVEGSVILAQAAFELLSWTLLVEDLKVLSESGFQSLPAMDKLRLLISNCKIPLGIPSTLGHLSAVAKAENWLDGPQTIVEYRNALVHSNPKKRKKIFSAKDEVRHEAWTLSLWYLELVLLWLFRYEGMFSSRVIREGFRGQEVRKVPWMPQ